MSFHSLLNNKCDVYERGFTDDANGQRLATDMIKVSGVACRFQNKGQSFNRTGRFQSVSDSDHIYLKDLGFALLQGTHYFVINGIKYEILDIIDLGGARRGFLEVNLRLTEQKING
jgi:hypothetical protein